MIEIMFIINMGLVHLQSTFIIYKEGYIKHYIPYAKNKLWRILYKILDRNKFNRGYDFCESSPPLKFMKRY